MIPDQQKQLDTLIEFYLSIHVSELTNMPKSAKAVWDIGQELYSAKLRRNNTKHERLCSSQPAGCGDELKVKIDALYDHLHNGIKYDEENNQYILVWTARQLEAAKKDAEEFLKKINWLEPEESP